MGFGIRGNRRGCNAVVTWIQEWNSALISSYPIQSSTFFVCFVFLIFLFVSFFFSFFFSLTLEYCSMSVSYGKKSETRITASVLKQDPDTFNYCLSVVL